MLCNVRGVAPATTSGAIAVDRRKVETFGEETPCHARCVQEVANVFARHMEQLAAASAGFVERVGITYKRIPPVSIQHYAPFSVAIVYHAVGLTRDEIDSAYSGRSKRSPEEEIAHRIVLG